MSHPREHIWNTAAYVTRILIHPAYALLFLVSSAITSMVLVWFFNLELIIYVMGNEALDAAATIGFFFESVGAIYAGAFDSVRNFLFVAFSLIFGLNVSVLVYIRRRMTAQPQLRKSSLATALLGAGCVACGGSILAPVLTVVGVTAAIGISLFINIIAFAIAICLGMYSLHMLLMAWKRSG